jgi:TonB family protein
MHRLAAVFAASLVFACAFGRDSSARVFPAGPQQPKVLKPSTPDYPPIAKAARAEGMVVVEAQVMADGSVASAEAVSGHPLLRKASETAAARWRFAPGGVGTTVRLTFEFRREVGKPESPYHLIIGRPKAPDTVSYIPADAENLTCEVHGFKLERDKVGITYGLMYFTEEYAEAKTTSFPHSNSWAGGGCVIDDQSPKFAEVLYCRACRAAESRWREEHGGEPEDDSEDEPGGASYVHRHH